MPTANSTSVKPPPLNIIVDRTITVQPLSTPAQREEYDRNRPTALSMTSHQILAMSEEERDEKVFKYLSPEEMWNVKEALKRIPPALDVSKTTTVASTDRSKDFDEYQKNRDMYLSLSDDDILEMPIIQIASYYPYLSAGEILDAYGRIERLKAIAVPVVDNTNDFKISKECSALLEVSLLPFCVDMSESGKIVFSDKVGGLKQNGLDLRRILLDATDEQIRDLHGESLKKLEPYFSINEMAVFIEKRRSTL